MTENERLINETWPLIRETVSAYTPTLKAYGWYDRVTYMPLRKKLEFWLALKRMNESEDDEVCEIARNAREDS